MSEWQPIETAPKNSFQSILIYVPTIWHGQKIFIAHWDDDKFAKKPIPRWESTDRLYSRGDARTHKPTHWMPLPEPPEVKL